MSVNTAASITPSGRVMNFAEETCFTKDEKFRLERTPVVFRLYSVGKRLGAKIDVQLNSDYGVYYDGDNEFLITALQQAVPAVDWRRLTYWCRPDQSRITMIDPTDDKPVAHLETRRYQGKPVCGAKVDAGEYGANVVSFGALVRAQAELVRRRAENGEPTEHGAPRDE